MWEADKREEDIYGNKDQEYFVLLMIMVLVVVQKFLKEV